MKQKLSSILKKRGMDYLLVFITLLILGFCLRESEYELRIMKDDISMMFLPAKLAGYNWPNVLDIAMYYGTGYYVLFTPLFKWIKDPILLYNVIIDINIGVVACCGVVLHYLLCGVLKYKDKWVAAVASIVATMIAYFDAGAGLTNEMPILLLSILLMILLAKFIQAEKINKRVAIMVGIVLLLAYSMTIHSRNIALAVAVFAIFLLLILLKNSENDDNKFFILLCLVEFLGFSYLLYKAVPDYIATKVYSAADGSGAMWNQEITIKATAFNFDFLKNIWILFIGNVEASIKNTYGLIMVSYILMIKLACRYIKQIFGIPKRSKTNTEGEIFHCKAVEIVFVFSMVCYLLGLLGLSITWAGMPRGSGYWRYYGTYSSGMLAVSFMYMIENKMYLNKLKKRICLAAALILGCFYIWVIPFLTDTEYLGVWFVYSCFEDMDAMIGFLLSALISIVGIGIIFCTKKKPVLLFALYFFAVQIISEFGGGHLTSIVANSKCDTGYRLISELEDELPTDEVIYFTGSDSGYMAYQYMLLSRPVIRGVPTEPEHTLVFSNLKNAIEDSGWYRIKIDSDEYVYTRDVDMVDKVYSILENIEGGK
ncbi:MAG: hypothetical protein K2G45_01515 [Lachnospiraceae bacterium]|nr:hypothetical protein [Lachnospiraceae bacterium]